MGESIKQNPAFEVPRLRSCPPGLRAPLFQQNQKAPQRVCHRRACEQAQACKRQSEKDERIERGVQRRDTCHPMLLTCIAITFLPRCALFACKHQTVRAVTTSRQRGRDQRLLFPCKSQEVRDGSRLAHIHTLDHHSSRGHKQRRGRHERRQETVSGPCHCARPVIRVSSLSGFPIHVSDGQTLHFFMCPPVVTSYP